MFVRDARLSIVRLVNQLGPRESFGETALITGAPRRATVTATSDVVVARGDLDDFHRVLTHHEVAESIARVVADRLARLAEPVAITLADGHTLKLRPGLSSDGTALAAAMEAFGEPVTYLPAAGGSYPIALAVFT